MPDAKRGDDGVSEILLGAATKQIVLYRLHKKSSVLKGRSLNITLLRGTTLMTKHDLKVKAAMPLVRALSGAPVCSY